MSDRFLTDVVQIHGVVTESSLISSAVYPEGLPVDEYSGEQVHEFVDIPLEGELLNIEVSQIFTLTQVINLLYTVVIVYSDSRLLQLKLMKQRSMTTL